jgi:hypothetical protein
MTVNSSTASSNVLKLSLASNLLSRQVYSAAREAADFVPTQGDHIVRTGLAQRSGSDRMIYGVCFSIVGDR